MSNALFLIDANALITPYKSFYGFDIAPKFWDSLEEEIVSGRIAILDIVKSEVCKGNDQLSEWIKSINIGELVSCKNEQIVKKYGEVLTYIQNADCYQERALQEWANRTVADAWLIAAAAVYNLKIVTFEVHNGGLSSNQPSKQAKIPDVADVFDVATCSLYDMMKELKISL